MDVHGPISSCMSSKRLHLNPHKTKFIWLGIRQQLSKLERATLASDFPLLTFNSAMLDLGVTLDCELTLAPHIHSFCRTCYYQPQKRPFRVKHDA